MDNHRRSRNGNQRPFSQKKLKTDMALTKEFSQNFKEELICHSKFISEQENGEQLLKIFYKQYIS